MLKPEFVVSMGSVLYQKYAVNSDFIIGFADVLKRRIAAVGQNTAIVTGGGYPAKELIRFFKSIGITDTDMLDSIAIAVTRNNARVLTQSLNKLDVSAEHVKTLPDSFPPDVHVMVTGGKEIRQSSDAVAAQWAINLRVPMVFNIGAPFVYHYLPNGITPDTSRPIFEMTGKEYLNLVGPDHIPGEKVPAGRAAIKIADPAGIIFQQLGPSLKNIENGFKGKKVIGTRIHP